MIRIAVNGAAGRMGQRVIALALAEGDLEVTEALESPESAAVGKALSEIVPGGPAGVRVSAKLAGAPDVLIDFSTPAGTLARIAECRGKKTAAVIGTTGFSAQEREKVEAAAKERAILVASNMSVGVNLLFELAETAARALGAGYDVEIVEAHHRHKKDAPSGTALTLAKRIAAARGLTEKALRHGREGITGERPREEIGMHAVRGGDIVGDHTVIFATEGERIELVHRAHSRDMFARGALRAARFLAGKKPGLYSFADMAGSAAQRGR
ncbi:MAG: 4-hydroxy-tetrahydrodipicolinate reductase [Planctomycetota bacterium]